MRKIIFLDIDGVLATQKSVRNGLWQIGDVFQDRLEQILAETNAEIVLSSSWRKHTVEDTRQYLTEEGFRFSDRITGVTIRAYHYLDRTEKVHLSIPRGVEIKQWVDTNVHSDNGKNWNRKTIGKDFNFVILDDDDDMLLEHKNHFVKCHFITGLTKAKANKAINMLNG